MLIKKLPATECHIEEELLFDFPQTETMTMGYIQVAPGEKTHLGSHPDEEEFYIILKGTASLLLGETVTEIHGGETVYVPRNTIHQMTCLGDVPLEYLYIANYPDIMPNAKQN